MRAFIQVNVRSFEIIKTMATGDMPSEWEMEWPKIDHSKQRDSPRNWQYWSNTFRTRLEFLVDCTTKPTYPGIHAGEIPVNLYSSTLLNVYRVRISAHTSASCAQVLIQECVCRHLVQKRVPGFLEGRQTAG